MLRISIVLLALGVLPAGPAEVWAAAPAAGSPLAENAALSYWMAFATRPQLEEDQESSVRESLDQLKPVGKDLQKVLEANAAALKELHRGAKMPQCDWGLALDEGFEALLPHLSKARELSRLACLRAHLRFGQGRVAEAVDDSMAAMTLGRHCAADGLLISLLVDYAIERQAMRVIARHLPSLKPADLRRLSQKLDALPSGQTMQYAAVMERKIGLEWVLRELSKKGGKQKILKALGVEDKLASMTRDQLQKEFASLRPLYDRLTEVVLLPPDEAEEAFDEAMNDPGLKGTAKQIADFMMSAIGSIRRVEAANQTRLALLKAAIAVVEQGPAALKQKDLQDPFGDGPFKYTARDGGFELKSELLDKKGKPVTLIAGAATE